MTTTARTASGVRPSTRYVLREHVVTGTAVELSNVVGAHRAAGTFLAISEPYPVTGGRFQVRMTLLEQAPALRARRAVRRRSRRAECITAAVAGAVLTLGTVGYLLGRLVVFVAAHLPLILGGLTVLLILAAVLGRSGVCTGIHCGGCKRH